MDAEIDATERPIARKPGDAPHILNAGVPLNHFAGANGGAVQVDGDFSFQAGALAAVFRTSAAFREEEGLVATEKHTHPIGVSVQRSAAPNRVLEIVERNTVRLVVEDCELQVLKASSPRPFPDVAHDIVRMDRDRSTR